jgi:hypothetical protein
MKHIAVVGALVAAALAGSGAQAQQIPLKGTLGSTILPIGGTYTTPASGNFVLTQLNGEALSGSSFGAAGLGASVFTPGLLLPPNETLTCVSQFTGQGDTCTLIWVLEK